MSPLLSPRAGRSGPRSLTHSDAFSWYLERDPLLRSTVVTLVLLDGPPDWEQLRARVATAVSRIPAFRSRVVVPPLGLSPPFWREADVDLDWHLQRAWLPPQDPWSHLLDLARRKAVTAFDPARPLWEATLVEGLPGGQAAFVLVFHHSLTDGIGGMQLSAELFDSAAGHAAQHGPDLDPPAPHHQDPSALRTTWEGIGLETGRLTDLLLALPRPAGVAWLRTLRSPLGSVAAPWRTAASVLRFVAPTPAAPATDGGPAVLAGRRLARSFELLEVPQADLHRAGQRSGGHLNDAFLTALTGGLRRYRDKHGSSAETLHVTMPISLRRASDAPGGNLLTLVRMALPLAVDDPAARLAAIHDIVERWRAEPSLALNQPISQALNLLPAAVVGGMLKHIDALASNVPGPTAPLHLLGRAVVGYYAFGPTVGSALNITLLTYAGTCCVAVACDTAAVPDPDLLVQCLRESFEEVLDLGGDHDHVRLPVQGAVRGTRRDAP